MADINTAEFMRAFDEWTDKASKAYEDTLRATALDMFSSIIKRTPVDKGRLRGNWQVGINTAPTGELEVDDKRGQRTITKARRTLESAKHVNDIYFVNNAPYAEVAEFGLWNDGPKTTGGYSKQAPSGMVRVTLTEFEQKLRKAARDNQL